ncbi:hypothetical protein [Streptomyces sp. NPDC050564]|uniref:hypothetical protein n=1 Tax=Streptomyces sp. NPDC050564 TaxID=3365631 RepID=UPI0037A2C1D6
MEARRTNTIKVLPDAMNEIRTACGSMSTPSSATVTWWRSQALPASRADRLTRGAAPPRERRARTGAEGGSATWICPRARRLLGMNNGAPPVVTVFSIVPDSAVADIHTGVR